MQNNKAISFSLWRDSEDYKLGAISNAIYAYYTFPGWDCIFYVTEDYDEETVLRLKEMEWVKIVKIPKGEKEDNSPILAKFLAASLDYEHVIFRSCVCRLISRDYYAVKEWVESGKDFHIIHDNPYLGFMPECTWGVRGGVIKDISILLLQFMEDAVNYPWMKLSTKNENDKIVFDISIARRFVENIIFEALR